MRNYERFSVSLVLWLFFVALGSHMAGAQTPLKTIDNPQGGRIIYGLVDGATSEAAAMSQVLRIVHTNCGERPQVGKIFKLRGTNSVAVFFTGSTTRKGTNRWRACSSPLPPAPIRSKPPWSLTMRRVLARP